MFYQWRQALGSTLFDMSQGVANHCHIGVTRIHQADGHLLTGIAHQRGSWMQFDLTPGEYEIREGSASYTGLLCVIGTNLNEEALTTLFGL